MKTLISMLYLQALVTFCSAGELKNYLLSAEELPKEVSVMEPTPKMPKFCNGRNPAVTSEKEGISEFCRIFLRDESLTPDLVEVSFTALRFGNEFGVFGHRLRDSGKIPELKKAYEFLISKVMAHRFVESGNVLIILWSKEPLEESKGPLDTIEAILRTKLKAHP